METTTIKVRLKTKRMLDQYREHVNESYDTVIGKLVQIAEDVEEDPKLSQETIKAIDAARERVRRGEYCTWDEMLQRMGLEDVYPSEREMQAKGARKAARGRKK